MPSNNETLMKIKINFINKSKIMWFWGVCENCNDKENENENENEKYITSFTHTIMISHFI